MKHKKTVNKKLQIHRGGGGGGNFSRKAGSSTKLQRSSNLQPSKNDNRQPERFLFLARGCETISEWLR
jgi:hypothetical protein